MSKTSVRTRVERGLPERANLEHLKNEAKQRLAAMRAGAPDARLAAAQFELAREYGFASWRELKAAVERLQALPPPVAVGDWIGALASHLRLALHVREGADGVLRATLDSPDYGGYDVPVDEFIATDKALSFALLFPEANATCELSWVSEAQHWSGVWLQNGIETQLTLRRGVYPSPPVIKGLDGIWDGRLQALGDARLILQVRTGPHGTLAWLDSPDRGGQRYAAQAITRDGGRVVFRMRTATISGELGADGGEIDARFVREERSYPLVLRRRPRGAPPPRGPHPPAADLAPQALAALTGVYVCGQVTARVSVEAGGLNVAFAGQPKLPVLTVSSTEVFWRDLDLSATFDMGPGGVATGFVLHHKGRDERYQRTT